MCLVEVMSKMIYFNLPFVRFASLNSASWLERRLKDKYVQLAKTENFRCRSAFKLIEIDKKFKILKPGLNVVDLGAAPGSWTQVLVQRIINDTQDQTKKRGKVVAVDRLPIHPIEHATIISKADFTVEKSRQRVLEALNNSKVNLVLSDMAPNATGIRSLDQEAIFELAKTALDFAVKTSSPNASFLVKIWDGNNRQQLEKYILQHYTKIDHIRPQSTQSESSELFLLARGFTG